MSMGAFQKIKYYLIDKHNFISRTQEFRQLQSGFFWIHFINERTILRNLLMDTSSTTKFKKGTQKTNGSCQNQQVLEMRAWLIISVPFLGTDIQKPLAQRSY